MTQRTTGNGSLLWCNVGVTSARAKAIHNNNNNNNNNNNKLLLLLLLLLLSLLCDFDISAS